jgi:alpha-glucosidase (family GH31 glycosyl hydrolase)
MAGQVTPVTNAGPLSKKGYFLLDDSHTALRDKATNWVKPRPEKAAQDWYFQVYGRDFEGGLQELAKLIGPSPMVPRYIFGAWFGSRAPYSDQQWKMIVNQFREESLPVDMLRGLLYGGSARGVGVS